MPWPWRIRLAAVPLVLPLLWPVVQRPIEGSFDLLVADIGQGTAVLVRTRAHLLVYDAGPQYSRESDAGQRVLVPLLRSRGEHHIDALVLSHRDIDHVGGAKVWTDGADQALLDLLPPRPDVVAALNAIRTENAKREAITALDAVSDLVVGGRNIVADPAWISSGRE